MIRRAALLPARALVIGGAGRPRVSVAVPANIKHVRRGKSWVLVSFCCTEKMWAKINILPTPTPHLPHYQHFPQIFPTNSQYIGIFPSISPQENQHFIYISTFYPYNLERKLQKVPQWGVCGENVDVGKMLRECRFSILNNQSIFITSPGWELCGENVDVGKMLRTSVQ